MNVLINDLQDQVAVDLAALEVTALTLLTHLHCDSRCELSIALVDDQAIQRLNLQYRGLDRPTDVLSFAFQETPPPGNAAPSQAAEYPLVLGDVIISTPTTLRQAREHQHAFETELYFLLIHGMLHLIGYDHQTDEDASAMEAFEQQLLHLLGQTVSFRNAG